MTPEEVKKQLFELQDLKYKEFHCKLIPTVNPDMVIGVRTPALRKFAREFAKDAERDAFMAVLPHQYYEENNLHGFLIETIKDYDICIQELNRFLPYVDNWATCDLMSPGVFKKHLPRLLEQIKVWIAADEIYVIRFGIEMLMTYYLDEEFCPEYLEWVAGIKSDEYYVKMMVAWYFATALAKQYEATVKIIEENRLEPWTHNKAIQKAVESLRIEKEQKEYLKSMKRRKIIAEKV